MLKAASSVIVLLRPRFDNHLLVVGLSGGASSGADTADLDAMVVEPTDEGALVVQPGVTVTGVHCVETGEDLKLDRDYAIFHTGLPDDFVSRFVPVLRTAVDQLGWPQVRASLKDYLTSRGADSEEEG